MKEPDSIQDPAIVIQQLRKSVGASFLITSKRGLRWQPRMAAIYGSALLERA